MKNTLSLLLLGLLLCGCSQKHASSTASTVPAIDLIQPDNDTSWTYFSNLHVTKRNGDSLEGVTITFKSPEPTFNGTQTLTADTATLSAVTNVTDGSEVIITLHNAKTLEGSPFGEVRLVLQK